MSNASQTTGGGTRSTTSGGVDNIGAGSKLTRNDTTPDGSGSAPMPGAERNVQGDKPATDTTDPRQRRLP